MICLDEVDQLNENRKFRSLSMNQCTLVLITNRHSLSEIFDDRTRSRLFTHEVEFPEYTESELIEIIRDRISAVLHHLGCDGGSCIKSIP